MGGGINGGCEIISSIKLNDGLEHKVTIVRERETLKVQIDNQPILIQAAREKYYVFNAQSYIIIGAREPIENSDSYSLVYSSGQLINPFQGTISGLIFNDINVLDRLFSGKGRSSPDIQWLDGDKYFKNPFQPPNQLTPVISNSETISQVNTSDKSQFSNSLTTQSSVTILPTTQVPVTTSSTFITSEINIMSTSEVPNCSLNSNLPECPEIKVNSPDGTLPPSLQTNNDDVNASGLSTFSTQNGGILSTLLVIAAIALGALFLLILIYFIFKMSNDPKYNPGKNINNKVENNEKPKRTRSNSVYSSPNMGNTQFTGQHSLKENLPSQEIKKAVLPKMVPRNVNTHMGNSFSNQNPHSNPNFQGQGMVKY